MAPDPLGSPRPGPYPFQRRLGAWPVDERRTEFRVWAPRAEDGVSLVIGGARLAMESGGEGIYELTTEAPPGTDYRFGIGSREWPDPASRCQPEGLRGPSRVVGTAGWGLSSPSDGFRAAPLDGQVIYELHIGTFSAEGTFTGAIPHLAGLAQLGVTAVEVMPIAEFPGTRGWGYDGVYISAAQSSYGGPEGFSAFIAAAHACGLAVILDCVYNHVGPGSDALEAFGPYFTDKYSTPWGAALNYDDAESGAVREWACQSAETWVGVYGVDGLRLDAVHAIFDSGPEHLVAELTRRVKAIRSDVLVIAESELNDAKVMRSREVGGWGADAAWADDFHHSLRTLLSDEREGYYADFGRVADLARALTHRYVYDGLWSGVRRRIVGAPAQDVDRSAFVVANQNHDQVGNRAVGDRMPVPARPLAAMLTLLSGLTPMLFMGEEYSEPAPFQYFVDHIDPEIAEATRAGRQAEFAAFTSFDQEVPDPMAESTFLASKLTRNGDPAIAALYRELIDLRRRLPGGDPDRVDVDEDERWLSFDRGEYRILANFAAVSRTLEVPPDAELVLGTGPDVRRHGDGLELPSLAGAVIRLGEVRS